MQTILIRTIPHKEQRYDTVGDYFTDQLAAVRQFRVSEMQNPDYEFLVAIHELIESHLVQKRGISDAAIDAFDQGFAEGEPGDDPAAPYYREHQFATAVERMVAYEIGVDWNDYEKAILAL